jgi:anaerobic carbon-monoxide dehydrogenase iron sulfur subunit
MEDLYVDMARCTGCRACEVACAVEHESVGDADVAGLAEDTASLDTVERGIRLQTSVAYARFERCVHCSNPPCVTACPNSAMSLDAELGVVFLDSARCQGCFMCGMVCPFGAIAVHPRTGRALKCDGCRDRALRGERPACVEACTTGALRMGGGRETSRRRRREAAALLADVMQRVDAPLGKGGR